MYPNQTPDGYMYNMHPYEPFQSNQLNYYQPFQLSFMNQQQQPTQPTFYPPQHPFNQHVYGPYHHPYPSKNKLKNPQPSQFSSIVSQFKTSDGNYDINKMMNTAGQMMNAMNQITGLVKQVGGFFIK